MVKVYLNHKYKKLEDLVIDKVNEWIDFDNESRSLFAQNFNNKYFKKHLEEYNEFKLNSNPSYYGNYIKVFNRYIKLYYNKLKDF